MSKKKKIERTGKLEVKSTDKDFVVPSMNALKASTGWKIIEDVLKANITKIELSILDADDNWSTEKLTKFRDMRYFEKQLLELPDRIIKSYEIEPESGEQIILDPYEKAVDNEE
jgi:hypothetical protein